MKNMHALPIMYQISLDIYTQIASKILIYIGSMYYLERTHGYLSSFLKNCGNTWGPSGMERIRGEKEGWWGPRVLKIEKSRSSGDMSRRLCGLGDSRAEGRGQAHKGVAKGVSEEGESWASLVRRYHADVFHGAAATMAIAGECDEHRNGRFQEQLA